MTESMNMTEASTESQVRSLSDDEGWYNVVVFIFMLLLIKTYKD